MNRARRRQADQVPPYAAISSNTKPITASVACTITSHAGN